MIEALKRLKQLEKREKELEEKLQVASASIHKSEKEKQIVREQMEKKEDEANEKAREIERSYIRVAEEEKIRLRKMVVELNGERRFSFLITGISPYDVLVSSRHNTIRTYMYLMYKFHRCLPISSLPPSPAALKRKDALQTEMESVKHSLQMSTVRSVEAESKLKDATRLQEFQAKRNEALLASNESLKSAAEVCRQNERRSQGKTEAMEKMITDLKAELETATEKTKTMERAVGVGNSRLLSTEVELRKARGLIDENAAKERRLAGWRIEEVEGFKAEVAKWKRAGQEKDSTMEEMQKRLDSMYETIKTQIETNSTLEKYSEDARNARVQTEKELSEARGLIKTAEEEARRRGDELARIQREAAEAAKAAENRITDLEREIEKGKEAAATAAEYEERNHAYIEALKTSLEANEKVGIRVEERYRAEAQEWKDKEACYEAQLREMQEMRERLDQLTTVDSDNHHHQQVLSAFRKGNADAAAKTDTDFSVLRNQARVSADKSMAAMEEGDRNSEVLIEDSSDELFDPP